MSTVTRCDGTALITCGWYWAVPGGAAALVGQLDKDGVCIPETAHADELGANQLAGGYTSVSRARMLELEGADQDGLINKSHD